MVDMEYSHVVCTHSQIISHLIKQEILSIVSLCMHVFLGGCRKVALPPLRWAMIMLHAYHSSLLCLYCRVFYSLLSAFSSADGHEGRYQCCNELGKLRLQLWNHVIHHITSEVGSTAKTHAHIPDSALSFSL